MKINSVTNNVYGEYGVGSAATVVDKKPVEPKYKKYLNRQPLVPYDPNKTVVKITEDTKDMVGEDPVDETTDNTMDPAEETVNNTMESVNETTEDKKETVEEDSIDENSEDIKGAVGEDPVDETTDNTMDPAEETNNKEE